jgi:hypothetical protein
VRDVARQDVNFVCDINPTDLRLKVSVRGELRVQHGRD